MAYRNVSRFCVPLVNGETVCFILSDTRVMLLINIRSPRSGHNKFEIRTFRCKRTQREIPRGGSCCSFVRRELRERPQIHTLTTSIIHRVKRV